MCTTLSFNNAAKQDPCWNNTTAACITTTTVCWFWWRVPSGIAANLAAQVYGWNIKKWFWRRSQIEHLDSPFPCRVICRTQQMNSIGMDEETVNCWQWQARWIIAIQILNNSVASQFEQSSEGTLIYPHCHYKCVLRNSLNNNSKQFWSVHSKGKPGKVGHDCCTKNCCTGYNWWK